MCLKTKSLQETQTMNARTASELKADKRSWDIRPARIFCLSLGRDKPNAQVAPSFDEKSNPIANGGKTHINNLR